MSSEMDRFQNQAFFFKGNAMCFMFNSSRDFGQELALPRPSLGRGRGRGRALPVLPGSQSERLGVIDGEYAQGHLVPNPLAGRRFTRRDVQLEEEVQILSESEHEQYEEDVLPASHSFDNGFVSSRDLIHQHSQRFQEQTDFNHVPSVYLERAQPDPPPRVLGVSAIEDNRHPTQRPHFFQNQRQQALESNLYPEFQGSFVSSVEFGDEDMEYGYDRPAPSWERADQRKFQEDDFDEDYAEFSGTKRYYKDFLNDEPVERVSRNPMSAIPIDRDLFRGGREQGISRRGGHMARRRF